MDDQNSKLREQLTAAVRAEIERRPDDHTLQSKTRKLDFMPLAELIALASQLDLRIEMAFTAANSGRSPHSVQVRIPNDLAEKVRAEMDGQGINLEQVIAACFTAYVQECVGAKKDEE